MRLKPWYKIVESREGLRECRPLDASEFTVHLDKVRDGTAPDDYRDPGRFPMEEGIGRDSCFWPLAQALSALYPSNTQEKRWVDGLLARKKGLGF